jgi:anti-anti-sigma factor
MNPDFEIESVSLSHDLTVLRVSGRLDARSAPVLSAQAALVRERGQHLVLNLSRVTFVASSGIGALLALVEEFANTRSSVRLAAVSPTVDAVVKLLNLGQFLRIDATEADSAAALRAA